MTRPPSLDFDLEEIRAQTLAYMQQAYTNDGLSRSDVQWLCATISDLIWKIKRDCPKAAA